MNKSKSKFKQHCCNSTTIAWMFPQYFAPCTVASRRWNRSICLEAFYIPVTWYLRKSMSSDRRQRNHHQAVHIVYVERRVESLRARWIIFLAWTKGWMTPPMPNQLFFLIARWVYSVLFECAWMSFANALLSIHQTWISLCVLLISIDLAL